MKAPREKGNLVMLGVIQEQHAERCRLFAQWKQFDWPILRDPINKLGLAGVPIVVEIDERGVTASINPKVEAISSSIAKTSKSSPSRAQPTSTKKPSIATLRTAAEQANSYAAWVELGDALVLWGESNQAANKAIDAYEKAKRINSSIADIYFRLGVAHRMVHDGPRVAANTKFPLGSIAAFETTTTKNRGANHFQAAVENWGRALELAPNQYIYRRRIQQYGPRLIKPYPFYDWIEQARAEIVARGDTPVELVVEPSGAELAHPSKQFANSVAAQSPDPAGRINRDHRHLVESNAVVVPAKVRAGETVRVHVDFAPQANVHWNNESEPLLFWVDVPDGWKAERQLFKTPMPKSAESSEQRSIEFELKTSTSSSDKASVRCYALYYVCSDTNGVCLFLRQDVEIPINIQP